MDLLLVFDVGPERQCYCAISSRSDIVNFMKPSLTDFISTDDLEMLARPVDQAFALPNHIYTSDEFAKLENKYLFPRLWVFAGYVHDIATNGDIKPVTVAGRPILLLRDHDGNIRAFLNSCRHRGMELIDDTRTDAKVIRCPYHSWTYGLDGRLRSTPHFTGYGKHKIDSNDAMDELGLSALNCGVWHDWVFVNLDGQAEPFADYVVPFAARFSDYDLSVIRHYKHYTIDTAANWKLIMENFIEPYHIATVHPLYNKVGPFQEYDIGVDGHCYSVSSAKGYPETWNLQPPTFPTLPEVRWHGTENCSLFPTLWMTASRDFLLSSIVVPVTAERTRWCWDYYTIGDSAEFETGYKELADYIDEVIAEDPPIIEGWHRGMGASDTARGLFSPPYEHHLQRWQQMLVDTMA